MSENQEQYTTDQEPEAFSDQWIAEQIAFVEQAGPLPFEYGGRAGIIVDKFGAMACWTYTGNLLLALYAASHYAAALRQLQVARAEIAALKARMRWVPVGERLPDSIRAVIVRLSDGYCKDGMYGHGEWGEDKDVTHWMDFPEVEK